MKAEKEAAMAGNMAVEDLPPVEEGAPVEDADVVVERRRRAVSMSSSSGAISGSMDSLMGADMKPSGMDMKPGTMGMKPAGPPKRPVHDKRRIKKYHNVARISTKKPVQRLKKMLYAFTTWAVTGEEGSNPIVKVLAKYLEEDEESDTVQGIRRVLKGMRDSGITGEEDEADDVEADRRRREAGGVNVAKEFAMQCRRTVFEYKDWFKRHEKLAFRVFNLFKKFYSDSNQEYGKVGRILRSAYAMVRHFFSDQDSCGGLIDGIQEVIQDGVESLLPIIMEELMGDMDMAAMGMDMADMNIDMRTVISATRSAGEKGRNRQIMDVVRREMRSVGKHAFTFLQADVSGTRNETAMGSFNYMMGMVEVYGRMVPELVPAVEEECAYIPELAEMSEDLKMLQEEQNMDIEFMAEMSQDIVEATVEVRSLAACGEDGGETCEALVEVAADLPIIADGIEAEAYEDVEDDFYDEAFYQEQNAFYEAEDAAFDREYGLNQPTPTPEPEKDCGLAGDLFGCNSAQVNGASSFLFFIIVLISIAFLN
jgi:hypothetical protein